MAVGLGMDAMSVCASIGVRWNGPRQKFRLAWHVGLFQFLMPIAGWLGGSRLADLFSTYGKYVAALLVGFIGVKMLYEAVRNRPGSVSENVQHAAEKELHVQTKDPTRGWPLVMLSVATSLDALVVGFSLGLEKEPILLPSVVIGIVAAVMGLIGVIIGKLIGKALGRWAEIAGGVVLLALAAGFIWL
jgi:putative Mn2+ efflux pump MntP